MANYVASFKVQLDDAVSQNARAAAAVMGELGNAVEKTQASTDQLATSTKDLGGSLGQNQAALGNVRSDFADYADKIGKATSLTAAMSTINATFESGLHAIKGAFESGNATIEETSEKEAKLAAQRDSQAQAARKQAQAVADSLSVQTQATTTATSSTATLGDSEGKLVEQEIALYTALSGGKAAFEALIVNMAKTAASSGDAASATSGLGTAFSALLSPTGLVVTALVGIGVVAYELVQRTANLETEQRGLATSLAATGRAADISVGQLTAYSASLKAAGVSASDANAIANQLARSQGLTAGQAAQVVSLTPDTSTALGRSDVDTAKLLTQASLGSADAIKQLDSALNILTPDQAANVAVMLDHGNKTEALKIAFDALHTRVDSLRQDSLSPLDKTFLALKTGWGNFIDAVATSAPVMMEVQVWANIFQALGNALKEAPLQQQLADLTGQAAQLQLQIAQQKSTPQSAIGAVTDWVKDDLAKFGLGAGSDLQKQLDLVNDKIAALVTKSQALKSNVSEANGSLTKAVGVNDPTIQEQKDLFTKAQVTVGNTTSGQIAALTAENQKYTAALAVMGDRTSENATRFDAYTAAIKANDDAITRLNQTAKVHRSELEKQSDALDALIREHQALTEAYSKGYDQVALIIAQQQAQKKVITDGLKPGTEAYAAAVQLLTDKELKLQQTKAQADLTKEVRDANAATEAQLRINAAYDGTALSITRAQNAEKARSDTLAKGLIPDTDAFTASVDKLTTAYDRTSAAAQVFAQQQASVQALSGAFTQAFSTIGNAITQAFVSGQGAAVNWGNVMKGVIAQVIQQIAQLAVINPLLNSFLGQNNGTLSSALSVLGNTGSSSSGTSTGGLSGLSSVGNLFSSGNSLYSSVTGSSLSSQLGLTGPNGLFSGVGSSISNFLDTPLWSSGAGGIPLEGAYSAEQVAAAGSTTTIGSLGSSIGGAVGSIGAGYGIGSTLGGLIAGNRQSGQQNAQIGAGIGSVAGYLIGGPLGSLIGGAGGGAFGSLFGPANATPYSDVGVVNSGGRLSVGQVDSQGEDIATQVNAVQAQLDTLNKYLSQAGLNITSPGVQGAGDRWTKPGTIFRLGDISRGVGAFPKYGSLDSGFSNLQFDSTADPILNEKITGKSFASSADLTAFISQFTAAQAAVKSFLASTTDLMKNLGVTTGALPDSLKALNDAFTNDKATVDALIATHDLSTQQVTDLTAAETQLAAARDQAIAKANKAATAQMDQADAGLNSRIYNAQASLSGRSVDGQTAQLFVFDKNATAERAAFSQSMIALYGDGIKTAQGYGDQMALLERTLGAERLSIVSAYARQIQAAQATIQSEDISISTRFLTAKAALSGSPADSERAALYGFDQGAIAQRAARSKELVDLYGPAIKASQTYAGEMALLEKTLGEERLAIVQSYADKITQTESATIISLSGYVQKLQTGASSPLSPTGQLSLAETQFDTQAALAGKGNATAIGGITGVADSLLSASRAVNGSGSGYAADFNKVLDTLSSIAQISPDTLTASAFASETQSATATLVASLATLKSELTAIKLQLQQGSNVPRQIAA